MGLFVPPDPRRNEAAAIPTPAPWGIAPGIGRLEADKAKSMALEVRAPDDAVTESSGNLTYKL